MRRICRTAGVFVAAVLLADAGIVQAAGNGPGDERLGIVTLRVYDTASLPARVMEAMRVTAESALGDALALRWLNCTASERRDAGCDDERTIRDVVVRVLGEHESPSRSACGYALTSQAAGGFISLAHGCARRASAAAARGRGRDRSHPTEAQVLGYVLAHELAHVLMPSVPHSYDGLFSAHLGRKHWRRHQQGRLTFAPADVARLRAAARQVMTNEQEESSS
jgi:hypothetical protein